MPKAKYKKRSDGRYLKQMIVGIKDDGSYAIKNIYGRTIEELERKIDFFKEDIKNGVNLPEKKTTLGQWAYTYCELFKKDNEFTRNLIERHIIPWGCSKKDIRKIQLKELQTFLNSKGKTRTAELLRSAFVDIYEKAVDYSLVSKNIAAKLAPIGYKAAQKRTLTELEEKAILTADLAPDERAFIYLSLFAGLRRGEALAQIKTGNECTIDLSHGLITVCRTVIYKPNGNKAILKPTPKTDASNRTNPIITPLKEALQACMAIDNNAPYLFVNSLGELHSHSSYDRLWERIIRKLNAAVGTPDNPEPITDLRSHILRHTFATYLAAANVHPSITQKLMGHSSAKTTLDIYTHLSLYNRYVYSPIFKYYKEFLPSPQKGLYIRGKILRAPKPSKAD